MSFGNLFQLLDSHRRILTTFLSVKNCNSRAKPSGGSIIQSWKSGSFQSLPYLPDHTDISADDVERKDQCFHRTSSVGVAVTPRFKNSPPNLMSVPIRPFSVQFPVEGFLRGSTYLGIFRVQYDFPEGLFKAPTLFNYNR